MTVRPGWGLLGIALLGAASAFGAGFAPAIAWLIPLAAVLAVFASAMDYLEHRRLVGQIDVTQSAPRVVGRGLSFSITVTISNRSNRAVAGALRAAVPGPAEPNFWAIEFRVEPGQQVEWTQDYRIAVRGHYQFGPLWIRTLGRFQFLEAQWNAGQVASVRVLPEGLVSREDLGMDHAAHLRLLDRRSRARERGHGTEFHSLAEYRPGDDIGRIDWRATARRQHAVIRRFQIERHRDLILLVDTGRLMGAEGGKGTKLDCAIDASLMLARVALERGDRCGLGIFDNDVRGYLPPAAGMPVLRVLAEKMSPLQSRWRESDFGSMFARLQSRQQKRAMVVILSDIVDTQTTQRFRASVISLAKRHVVLFAALRTPAWQAVVHEPIDSILDGARHAVAFRTMHERDLALSSLRHSGIHVLDVEPALLTVPLIREFVELRSRNLI